MTHDGNNNIHNGIAEFIAQEEMNRYTGYWWSQDERYVAFTQTNDSNIDISNRYEITANSFSVFKQRYPYTGKANVKIRLGIVRVSDGKIIWVDFNDDIYLARVNWLPNNKYCAVQIQHRDQKILELLFVDVNSCNYERILREESETWINPHDDIYFFESKPWFIYGSERNGYKHLYLYNTKGGYIKSLTERQWVVHRLLSVDENKNLVYSEAYIETPIEKHMYCIDINSGSNSIKKITTKSGWHSLSVSEDNSYYIDDFSNPDTPPQSILHKITGEFVAFIEENALNHSHPYYPYLADHSSPDFCVISASDGQDIYCKLMEPANFEPKKVYPVIINVYGGPIAQKVTSSWGNMWEQYLVSQGHLVFQLDNRGTGNRGKLFENPIYRELGKIELEDQLAGVSYLKSLPFVDKKQDKRYWS